MKTDTKRRIIKLLEINVKMRPHDLRLTLKISSVALHKQLRDLLNQKIIEKRGSPPYTLYSLAGIPDFETVIAWAKAKNINKNNMDIVCETRDVFAARLPRLKDYLKRGFPASVLPLVISAAGEIGSNSFDHNLGQWQDVTGCWFESQLTGQNLWLCIADRGRGVFQSLAKNHSFLKSDQQALKAAFETIISGRAPEQRGNGLKFVRNIALESTGGGLACISGDGNIHYGEQGERCAKVLAKYQTKIKGTLTIMVWSFQ